ncbi:TPA: helix-turn-helix domain-containing protein [Escherichia coli]
MSMRLMVEVFHTEVGNPMHKLVLLKLADNANDNGECYPSYQHIAKQCEINKSTAMRAIEALCKKGLLLKQPRYLIGGKEQTSNFYVIVLPSLSGSGTKQPGVVAESNQGSGTKQPGVVAESNPNQSYITSKENTKENILIIDDDRNAFENIFWPAYPRKVAKQAAFKSFKTRAREWVKENKSTAQAFAEMLVKDLERRKGWFGSDKLHPTTYLNQKRWLDEPEGGDNKHDSNAEGKTMRRIIGRSGQVYERMLTDEEYAKYLEAYKAWQQSQNE